jgi:hypothetical protein
MQELRQLTQSTPRSPPPPPRQALQPPPNIFPYGGSPAQPPAPKSSQPSPQLQPQRHPPAQQLAAQLGPALAPAQPAPTPPAVAWGSSMGSEVGVPPRPRFEQRTSSHTVKLAGLAHTSGQLDGSSRDLQPNSWTNLRMLGQPCGFQVPSHDLQPASSSASFGPDAARQWAPQQGPDAGFDRQVRKTPSWPRSWAIFSL